jgi:hypothetical protein
VGAWPGPIHGVVDERVEFDLIAMGARPEAARELNDARHHFGELVELRNDRLLQRFAFPGRKPLGLRPNASRPGA